MEHCKKRGFTLVELIVVLVILAILAAILIPSFSSYIRKADQRSAVSECRSCVLSAQTLFSEAYAEGQAYTNSTLPDAYPQIESLAEVPGHVIEAGCDDASVLYLVYQTGGWYVSFQNQSYTVSSEAPNLHTIESYLRTSSDLLPGLAGLSGSTWTNLRNQFQQVCGGSNPGLSAAEKSYLAGASDDLVSSLTWKPTILGDRSAPTDVMLIASADSYSVNNAYLVYYNGTYYYHCNGYNTKPDSSFVTDQGGFDVSSLTRRPASGGYWIAVK